MKAIWDHKSDSFFDALREVAASPADIAPRAVAVEQGKSLAAGFNTYAMQLDQMKNHIQNTLQDRVNELNLLAQSLADINTDFCFWTKRDHQTLSWICVTRL